MPPKKHPETPAEQSDRFKKEAAKLIKSGELDPEQGEEALNMLVKRGRLDGR